jgi:hypothetical protein
MRYFLSLLIILSITAACTLATNEPLGSQCSDDSNCTSGRCAAGVDCPVKLCVCRVDGDCPSGQHCVTTIDCHPECQ